MNEKNNFIWLFASSTLLALSITNKPNKVKADIITDDNSNSQVSTKDPSSVIILNNTHSTSKNNKSTINNAISENSSSKSVSNTTIPVNNDIDEKIDTIKSTWGDSSYLI